MATDKTATEKRAGIEAGQGQSLTWWGHAALLRQTGQRSRAVFARAIATGPPP
jgi:hypothetical protein